MHSRIAQCPLQPHAVSIVIAIDSVAVAAAAVSATFLFRSMSLMMDVDGIECNIVTPTQ